MSKHTTFRHPVRLALVTIGFYLVVGAVVAGVFALT